MLANVKAKVKRLILSSQSKPIVYTADPNHEFAGKVALISGGSGGIGVDIAKALIEGGCTVVIAGTNENKLHDLRNDMNCDSIVMDYSRPDSFDDVLRTVVTNHGKLDIFVSSAGVHTENVDFWTMTPNEYDRVMNINLKGTFFACHPVGKYMRDANVQGSILLISSIISALSFLIGKPSLDIPVSSLIWIKAFFPILPASSDTSQAISFEYTVTRISFSSISSL